MDGLVIQFTLGQFVLGAGSIVGTLIWIAWTFSGRFTKIETDVSWLRESVKKIDVISSDINELRVNAENKRAQLFAAQSPVRLTDKGNELLTGSGLKDYIDSKPNLLAQCVSDNHNNAYEVQLHAFELFDSLEFDAEFDTRIKQYAFDHGISLDIVKRVGALYFRDLCLEKLGMNDSDIDTHIPTPTLVP